MISRRSLLLGGVAALVAPPFVFDAARAAETFIDEQNRFSFLVPDGYLRETTTAPPVVASFTTTRFGGGGFVVIVQNLSRDIGANGTLRDLERTIPESIRSFPRYESGADALTPTSLGDRPALAYGYVLYDGNDTRRYVSSVTALFATTQCTLSTYARNVDGGAFDAETEAIHRSFTFLEGADTIGATPLLPPNP